jgi:hypothetical protein
MDALINRHSLFWNDKTIRRHVFVSVVLLAVGMLLMYYARDYTNDYLGEVVPDLLLDSIPVVNVGFIFFQGAFLFVLVLVGILVWSPLRIPFVLESTALFFFFRAFFMVMTHLAAPATEYYRYVQQEHHIKEVLFTISSGNDLFFSGHAGYPFLLALVFWKQQQIRLFFLLASLIGSVAVIVGHLHYSIDVFSAYFISFGVFEMSKSFFKKEYRLMQEK